MDTIQTKPARVIAAQFYAAKGLKRNPAKTIKFIRDNQEYFPIATPEWIKLVMEEQNVTEEDIENEHGLVFADIKTEERAAAELDAKSKKIHIMRKQDHKKREFGYGIKKSDEGDDNPINVYDDITLQETNEHFARLSVNLKEKEFKPIEVKGPETGGEWEKLLE